MPRALEGRVTALLAGATDVGLIREHNEDSLLVYDLDTGLSEVERLRSHTMGPHGTLLIVCDGMGGAAAGEVASAMAVSGMRRLLSSTIGPAMPSVSPEPAATELERAAPAPPADGATAAEPATPEPATQQATDALRHDAGVPVPAAGEATESAASSPLGPGPDELAPEVLRLAQQMRDAVFAVNLEIFEAACADMAKAGMGTTLTSVLLRQDRVLVAQVGDSRAYLWRQGKLTQITHDQSLVNQLLDTGQITLEQARLFEHSNVILQALGVQEDVEVLVSTEILRREDRILVCSDGLVGVVSDDEIQEVLGMSCSTDEMVQMLIDLARAAGGPDNITVIVAQMDGDGLAEAAAIDEVKYRPMTLDPPPQRSPRYVEEPQQVPRQPLYPAPRVSAPPALPMSSVLSVAWVIGLAVAWIIVARLLYPEQPSRGTPGRGAICYFLVDTPGLEILLDQHPVARSTLPGTEVPISPGLHRVALGLGNGSAVIGEEVAVNVVPGQRCAVRLRSPMVAPPPPAEAPTEPTARDVPEVDDEPAPVSFPVTHGAAGSSHTIIDTPKAADANGVAAAPPVAREVTPRPEGPRSPTVRHAASQRSKVHAAGQRRPSAPDGGSGEVTPIPPVESTEGKAPAEQPPVETPPAAAEPPAEQ